MNIGSDADAVTSSLPPKVTSIIRTFSVTALSQKHNDFDAFMAELEADPANAQDLTDAGAWIADTFYASETETVRTARLRKGLSQKQLAAAMETSQAQIAKIESGRLDPHYSTLVKLAEALDLDANRLFAMLANQASTARR